jgi:hypothetical protein
MPARKIVMAAFNQGAVPTIACVNNATVDLGVDSLDGKEHGQS